MSWEKSKQFGVIKQDGPKRLHLHHSNLNYNILTTDVEIKDSRWSGDHLLVTLSNGKVRRYRSLDNYTTI